MNTPEATTWIDESMSMDSNPLATEEMESLFGKWLRRSVAIVYISYGIVAFGTEMKIGFYGFKIPLLCISALLIFSPPSYPYFLGLLTFTYYFLKSGQLAGASTNYVAQYAAVMIILMALVSFVRRHFRNVQNPYQRFDLGSLCLVGLTGIAVLGIYVIENRFYYFSRFISLAAFCCAFYLGRSFVINERNLRLLLAGLALGLIAFSLPASVGFIFRYGPGAIGRLDVLRGEVEGVSLGFESGTTLIAFVVAYSLSCSSISHKTRWLALWLVAIPAGIVVLIYLSRGAIILLPITIFFNLILSGRRRAAITVAIATGIIGAVAFFKFPGLFFSITQRMFTLSGAAYVRQLARLETLQIGLSHLLLGVGSGQLMLYHAMTAHNEPLSVLAEYGAGAFLLYILFFIYLGYKALRLRMSKDLYSRSLAGVFLVLIMTYFLYTQIQPMYYVRGGFLFAFFVGMLTTLYYWSEDPYRVYGSQYQS